MADKKFNPGDLVRHKAHHAQLTPPLMTVHGYQSDHVAGLAVICKYYDKSSNTFHKEAFHQDELVKWPE